MDVDTSGILHRTRWSRQAVSAAGSTLTIRPYSRNEHYWQVYFDTNRLISQLFGAPAAIHAT
jgi:hypothetical protein